MVKCMYDYVMAQLNITNQMVVKHPRMHHIVNGYTMI